MDPRSHRCLTTVPTPKAECHKPWCSWQRVCLCETWQEAGQGSMARSTPCRCCPSDLMTHTPAHTHTLTHPHTHTLAYSHALLCKQAQLVWKELNNWSCGHGHLACRISAKPNHGQVWRLTLFSVSLSGNVKYTGPERILLWKPCLFLFRFFMSRIVLVMVWVLQLL